MYATVRRYESVSDPGEVVRIVNEGFLPIIRETKGSWITTSSMAETVCWFRPASLRAPPVRKSRTGGPENSWGSI
jgi:hypothetical protein